VPTPIFQNTKTTIALSILDRFSCPFGSYTRHTIRYRSQKRILIYSLHLFLSSPYSRNTKRSFLTQFRTNSPNSWFLTAILSAYKLICTSFRIFPSQWNTVLNTLSSHTPNFLHNFVNSLSKHSILSAQHPPYPTTSSSKNYQNPSTRSRSVIIVTLPPQFSLYLRQSFTKTLQFFNTAHSIPSDLTLQILWNSINSFQLSRHHLSLSWIRITTVILIV
jgi:hypothetical protein